jgi:hypothetical protein
MSIWRCVACGRGTPRRYPSFMRGSSRRPPTIHRGPRGECRRLLARTRHLSGAPLQPFQVPERVFVGIRRRQGAVRAAADLGEELRAVVAREQARPMWPWSFALDRTAHAGVMPGFGDGRRVGLEPSRRERREGGRGAPVVGQGKVARILGRRDGAEAVPVGAVALARQAVVMDLRSTIARSSGHGCIDAWDMSKAI